MSDSELLWVLGHKVRPLVTDASYGMIEVTTPPKVAGPPPHYHKRESEFFFIIKGQLDVMSNGHWQPYAAGSFVELPPHTTHTFINHSGEDVVWITGWRPKGFERFFVDFGIPISQPGAREQSVSAAVLQRVVDNVESYGMYIDASPADATD
ncbi:cupin domain-containing protein [Crenobacter sp. SG2303]|uniref:Cupin domain-containing protein n=1 Tax=Crenobacter oryzisoli TaxID=3056844 RepID=A0ABT7XPF4_9NEIS|nr:cupin domain-containing protein [Crenobacter sp. SG2303]MDN0075676.1 cupin domain-containing protein [Crenobacter sp. SG2303]